MPRLKGRYLTAYSLEVEKALDGNVSVTVDDGEFEAMSVTVGLADLIAALINIAKEDPHFEIETEKAEWDV